jgi:RNA polymerase sigma factor (sigma-70 family)
VKTANDNALASELHTDVDAPSDALELHFRQLSHYPLLTAEGELALARELERADGEIARALLSSSEGRELVLELLGRLRSRELAVEDVERNPGEEIETRLERVLRRWALADVRRKDVRRTQDARARRPLRGTRGAVRAAARPRAAARGATPEAIRFHPRAVRAMAAKLAARATREPKNSELRETLVALASARRDADRATAEFVQSNLRIVITFARRFRGLPLADLIQEGNLGLLRAVDKFDYRRGLRFSTYAAWWIRHSLNRALADQSKMIRYPVHLAGAIQRLRRMQERMLRETGRQATHAELAERSGLPIEQVQRAMDVVAQPVSLDAPLSSADREGTELGDLVPDGATPAADEEAAAHELEGDTRALLAELPEREAEVIRMRFGLGGHRQRTLEEVGARLSLSRERARQLERDALRKLRVASERRQLRAHLAR